MTDVVHFGEEPFAVRLMPKNVPIENAEEMGEVCPLIAVQGNQGLVVRNREMFWWPLDRIRVILQPKPEPADPLPRERDIDDDSSGEPPTD